MTAYIPLNDSEFTVLDLDDVPKVLGYKWCVKRYPKTAYAAAWISGVKTTMHRLLRPDWPMVDHVNRDGLDNRTANLRPTTKQKNSLNTAAHNTWKGVSFDKARRLWEAWMTVDRIKLHLGRFKTAEEAAIVRDRAVWEWAGAHGEYNFPEELP